MPAPQSTDLRWLVRRGFQALHADLPDAARPLFRDAAAVSTNLATFYADSGQADLAAANARNARYYATLAG